MFTSVSHLKKKKNWLKKGPRIEAGNPEQREDGTFLYREFGAMAFPL